MLHEMSIQVVASYQDGRAWVSWFRGDTSLLLFMGVAAAILDLISALLIRAWDKHHPVIVLGVLPEQRDEKGKDDNLPLAA
jgi:hypothetical protein